MTDDLRHIIRQQLELDEEVSNKPLTRKELYRILRRNNLVGRLRRRAFIMFILGMTGPLWIMLLSAMQPVSMLLKIVYPAFMMVCGLGSLYWWYRLGQVYNYMAIPLVVAQRKLAALERLRRQVKYGCWIIGAPVIALTLYEIAAQNDSMKFTAAIVGGSIGCAIGLTLEYLNRRQMKAVRRSFDPDTM